MPTYRAKPGDKQIPASFLNAVARSLDTVTPHPDRFSSLPPEGLISIRNDGVADIERYQVMGISGVTILPSDVPSEFASKPVMTGVLPDATHAEKFVVARDPIPQGAIGRAWITGVFPAIINVSDEAHEYVCAPVMADYLTSCALGIGRILWKESGTGDKWALVRIQGGAGGAYDEPSSIQPASDYEGAGSSTPYVYNTSDYGDPVGQDVVWHRDYPNTGQGSILRVVNRVVYKPDTDKKIYQYMNDWNFDSAGMLLFVGPEYRAEVATPEACE